MDRAPRRFVARWIDGARRHGRWIVPLAAALTAAIAVYAAQTLTFNSDTADMIDESLAFRKADAALDRAFPQRTDTLVVVIDGATPGAADDAAAALAARLDDDATFKSVYRPFGQPFFVRNGLLYLDVDELAAFADNLAAVQPLLGELAHDPSLRGLFGVLETAVEEAAAGDDVPFDLGRAFDKLNEAAEAVLAGRPYRLSWHEVISGETASTEERRRIIVLQPHLDFARLAPGEAAIAAVRAAAADLGLDAANGVRVRLTGNVALSHDQLKTASTGAGVAAPVSLVLVGGVLFLGLRSARLVAAALATLVVGLIWTAGFAAAAIGELNLISVTFAVLFIGLGVAFSIHMCLRYRELVRAGRGHREALTAAGGDVGGALFLCAATTAAGFYVFIPTDYAGVSELGLIAGTGMFISLAANYTVLPAILGLMPLRHAAAQAAGRAPRPIPRWLSTFTARHRRTVQAGALVLAAAAAATLPFARFDFNPLNLQDPSVESVTTIRELLGDGARSPWSLTVLAADLGEAEALAARLDALDAVDDAVTIADYVPKNQEEKLAIIEQMALFMGPPPLPGAGLEPPDAAARRAALDGLADALAGWLAADAPEPAPGPGARRLAANLERLAAAGDGRLAALEAALLDGFSARLDQLYAALSPSEPVGLDDLPPALVEREVAADGRVRVEVFPEEDLSDNAALGHFVAAVRTVAPDAVGAAVSMYESGQAVVGAFRQALASAVLAVAALVLALMRRPADVALVMAPLLLAAGLTVAASVVLDVPFNFANVIVLPLLFGVGVDSAIHLVHRHRIDPAARPDLLATSTARAVVFGGLTTICGFGSLMLSSHRGTATMGELLAIGIGFVIVCTLIVLPALLPPAPDRDSARAA